MLGIRVISASAGLGGGRALVPPPAPCRPESRWNLTSASQDSGRSSGRRATFQIGALGGYFPPTTANLNQKAGDGQSADANQSTSGEAFLEDLFADLSELVRGSVINSRHGHQILQTLSRHWP
jgi:hypothetical protein